MLSSLGFHEIDIARKERSDEIITQLSGFARSLGKTKKHVEIT
jgi:hypothetical protein